MVDWDRIERLRARGWDWDRIAGDEKVDFHADAGAGEPGRALRSLYFQRRSRSQRKPEPGEPGKAGRDLDDRPRWTLLRVAYVATPMFGIWFLLAYLVPSPLGVYVTAIPTLAILLCAAAAVLAFALFRSTERWNRVYRNGAVIGIVAGLALTGMFGLAAYSQGCPNLTSSQSAEPNGWTKAANSPWQQDGAPVFYFYGATACPFCSASSWAIWYSLSKMGTVSGVTYSHSSSTDTFPNTPEIVIDTLSVQSQYVALVAAENHDPVQTLGPVPSGCTQQAFVSAYDSQGIPFVVVNGQYIHQKSLVDPTNLAGLTPEQVMGEMTNQSGAAWDAISPAAYWLLAFMVKVNNGAPANVAAIPQVANDLGQIT